MSTFNRSIAILALGLCGLVVAGQAGAEIKIGFVNFQKLLEEAPQTKTAMQALENEFAPRRRELMTMQNDLKAREDKLQKEGAVMSEADRSKAEKTLRDQQREFSRKAGEFQDDASTRKNEELGKVQRYLFGRSRRTRTRKGFDLVLGDGVFFAKGPLDITANVLAVLQTKPAQLPPSAPKTRRPRDRRSRPAAPNSPLILSHGMCASARGFQPGRVGGSFRTGAAGRSGHPGVACGDPGERRAGLAVLPRGIAKPA